MKYSNKLMNNKSTLTKRSIEKDKLNTKEKPKGGNKQTII